MTLDDILAKLADVPEADKAALIADALSVTKEMRWVPNPGPQTEAYFCLADELFYGGQAGGGKTDLAIGTALNDHERSLILRRTNKEAAGLVDRLVEMVGVEGVNRQTGTYRTANLLLEVGGCELEDDKQKRKGIPHSLKAFDEISDFTETQYTFIIGWNRSAKPKQRCRIIATGNPPTKPEGLWVLKRWGAWLDPEHPNPAKPGELRWYTTVGGKDTEVDGPGPHYLEGEKEPVYARSRTFIPAELSDNPDLEASGYAATLAALPPELREAYRDGKFGVALRDDAMQCIPTAWVHEANARWTPHPPLGVPMCAIGVDVAQGGNDRTVLAPRYDGWFAKPQETPGRLTPDGKKVAGLVVAARKDGAKVIIDIGGGWGGDAYAHMRENGIDAVSYMGVKASGRRTQDNTLKFFNVRTEAYWCFREALDPSQPQGSTICLPPDKELEADLCAPRFEVRGHGEHGVIHLESKEKVMARIGRSPDKGDAVVMAWFDGLKQCHIPGGWEQRNSSRLPSRAIMKRR